MAENGDVVTVIGTGRDDPALLLPGSGCTSQCTVAPNVASQTRNLSSV
jgi:hypothetical protein